MKWQAQAALRQMQKEGGQEHEDPDRLYADEADDEAIQNLVAEEEVKVGDVEEGGVVHPDNPTRRVVLLKVMMPKGRRRTKMVRLRRRMLKLTWVTRMTKRKMRQQ